MTVRPRPRRLLCPRSWSTIDAPGRSQQILGAVAIQIQDPALFDSISSAAFEEAGNYLATGESWSLSASSPQWSSCGCRNKECGFPNLRHIFEMWRMTIEPSFYFTHDIST